MAGLKSIRSLEALTAAGAAPHDAEPQVRELAWQIVSNGGVEALPWLRKMVLDTSSIRRSDAI